uniref:Putative secreted protein n=1 Tax=Anopheles marajoara TaxID=58244 RepID=A0A2M4CD25_9DIPT
MVLAAVLWSCDAALLFVNQIVYSDGQRVRMFRVFAIRPVRWNTIFGLSLGVRSGYTTRKKLIYMLCPAVCEPLY